MASPGTVDPSEPIARGDEEAVVASHHTTAEELLSEEETVTESAFSSEGDDSGFGEEDHPAVSPAHIREEKALARSASLDSLVPAEANDASVEDRSTQARMDEIVERESLTYPPELRGLFSPSSPSAPPLSQPPAWESTPPVVSPVVSPVVREEVREEAQPYKPTAAEQSEQSERSERSTRVRSPRRIADNNRLEKELRAMHVLVGSLLESIGGGGGGDDGGDGDGGGDDGGDSGCAGDNGGSGGGSDGLSDRNSPQRGSPPRGSSDYSLERPRKWVDTEDDDSPLPSPLPSYKAAANTESCSAAAAASPMRPLEMGGTPRVSRYGA